MLVDSIQLVQIKLTPENVEGLDAVIAYHLVGNHTEWSNKAITDWLVMRKEIVAKGKEQLKKGNQNGRGKGKTKKQ